MDAVKFGSAQPPAGEAHLTIQYEIRKIDLFAAHMTILLRNRVLLLIVLLMPLLPVWTTLSNPETKRAPLIAVLVTAVLAYAIFISFFFVLQALFALANIAFKKHRGVIGKHTLQITDEGLIERTDVNEAISKWAGLHKVVSGPKYLYIYVTESNAHIVPKRYFPSHGIEGFAAELRSRAAKARGLS